MLAQGRDYVQLKTRSAVLESDCLDFLFEGFQVLLRQPCTLMEEEEEGPADDREKKEST
jgi:hypothetical protein